MGKEKSLKVSEINFDNLKDVEANSSKKVEVSVEQLHILLSYFYIGGGEPEKLNDRWKVVKEMSEDA